MIPHNLEKWQKQLEGAPPEEILAWAVDTFGEDVTLASAMGPEAQVLTSLIAKEKLPITVFTLDTGRLFDETYALIAETEDKFDIRIKMFAPRHQEVEELVNREGINLFRQSLEHRKSCCGVRKVSPLRRALSGKKAWMTGLRREQATTRGNLQVVDWDEAHGLIKINPMIDWSENQVWRTIRENDIPYNSLVNRGFTSIGCAPCTRAVKPGEDIRAGRWWWETPEQKECGIHVVNGQVVRNRTAVPA